MTAQDFVRAVRSRLLGCEVYKHPITSGFRATLLVRSLGSKRWSSWYNSHCSIGFGRCMILGYQGP